MAFCCANLCVASDPGQMGNHSMEGAAASIQQELLFQRRLQQPKAPGRSILASLSFYPLISQCLPLVEPSQKPRQQCLGNATLPPKREEQDGEERV